MDRRTLMDAEEAFAFEPTVETAAGLLDAACEAESEEYISTETLLDIIADVRNYFRSMVIPLRAAKVENRANRNRSGVTAR